MNADLTRFESEDSFASAVEQLANTLQPQLIDLLREDHPIYDGRGAATVSRMRGWVLLSLARKSLPETALPFVLEELDTGIHAYTVAAAAFALRSYPHRNSAFGPFVTRAINNIRYHDEQVSFKSYGGYAIGPGETSPVRELLSTLIWLGPHASAIVPDLEQLRTGPTALGKKLLPKVNEALASIHVGADAQTEPADCCQLPGMFSFVRTLRTSSKSIEDTIFEDQDGESLTFAEFFHGRPSIVVFFYTRCDNPLKCSLTITKLARLQQWLERESVGEQINIAGITYDPEFDQPERLRIYGEQRGVQFTAQHRLLRARDGIEALRKHFKLGVNFIESLVNRHRIEVYLLDASGRIAASFERIQWDETEVITRTMEILTEGRASAEVEPSTRSPRNAVLSPVFGMVIALALALFPKCPLCWAAYLSLFGIAGLESIPYSPWLMPVLALLLLFNVTSVWFRARSTGRMFPFYLVLLGAVALITTKVFVGLAPVAIAGVVLTLIGSLWGTLSAVNRRQLARQ
ncbi:MAG TPA: SCO family protein [Pyrinomonadaceae bacterium]|nr:SCO family protein [Pyrinomonadaceae bacterium]